MNKDKKNGKQIWKMRTGKNKWLNDWEILKHTKTAIVKDIRKQERQSRVWNTSENVAGPKENESKRKRKCGGDKM